MQQQNHHDVLFVDNKWTLSKRYSEFSDFRESILDDQTVKSLPFPEKQVSQH
jgi:hypothetical protein